MADTPVENRNFYASYDIVAHNDNKTPYLYAGGHHTLYSVDINERAELRILDFCSTPTELGRYDHLLG